MLLAKSKIYTSKIGRREGDIFQQVNLLKDNLISNRIIVSLYLLRKNRLRQKINTAQVMRYGSLSLIKLALLNGLILNNHLIESTLERDTGEVFDYMRKYKNPRTINCTNRAIMSGNISTYQYFRKNDQYYALAIFTTCVTYGNINVIKYVLKKFPGSVVDLIPEIITYSYDKFIFQYLENIYKKYTCENLDYSKILRSCYLRPHLQDYVKTKIDTKEELCCICLEELYKVSYKERRSLNCKHVFHRACLREHLKIKDDCPLCRKKILGVRLIRDELQEADLQI